MANIKDFIKKIGNETVSLEEQQKALAAVEQTIVEAKAKREESIGKNVDLVISALKNIESKLESKLDELNNTPAKQGIQGQQGPAGRDGRDGVDGYAGRDGKDGVDGKDGKDGTDGISVSDAQIDFDGSLLITLSDGREIDAGTVIPLDVAKQIHSVSTNGGGTSQPVLDAIAAIQATIATYGTMATQNANAVAVTGGTINNTVIGATTPAAGTFTTITGQTEVLRGTGSNLIKQSQTIGTSPWNQTGTATAATNSSGTTDPLGGNTASLITGATDVGFAGNAINQLLQVSTAQQVVSGVTYTYSVYIKAGTATTMQIAMRDNSTGNLPTTTLTPTSSWQRISVSMTLGSSTTSIYALLGAANGTFYAWGAQVEYGSTANAYVATTTTAVYGTPTLSFSGVAGLGLQSDGSLYVSPAGTGALQAQATTSSTVGGNARGANAVDWQTSRDTAARVASGSTSFIGSGRNNTASGQDSFVGGGFTNTASSSQAAVVSGARNSASNPSTFIGGGNDNTAGFTYATVVGGQTNTASGYFGFVGNGLSNSTTSSSAVTTQGTTSVTSGSTSVTLSGSNANIKVGQLITGTGINFPDTYVAAISGTALTLSRTATGTGTPTLSFYTPHGVVVGGGNNQATGSYSFIGGGGDAGTAANRNVASGDWSFVGGGIKNTASGLGAFIGSGGWLSQGSLGAGNTATGVSSTVLNGAQSNATGSFATVINGTYQAATGTFSTVATGSGGSTRSIQCSHVISAVFASNVGDAQTGTLVLRNSTTDATPTVVTTNGTAAGTTNQVILPNNSAYYFKVRVIAGVTGAGNTKAWTLEGAIKRGAGVGTTAIVGTVTTTIVAADVGAATWTVTATADTTNGGLAITVTGQASTTIRWVAKAETAEMTF